MKITRLNISILSCISIAIATWLWSRTISATYYFGIMDPAPGIPAIRYLFVALIILATVYLLWKNWNRNFRWWTVGAILYAALFHIRYAVIAGQSYSSHSVVSINETVKLTAATSILSLALVWWVSFSYLGVFKMESRRAAEITFELIFAILLLLGLPISLNFALNGVYGSTTLSGFPGDILNFVCIIQAFFVSGTGIILSGATGLMAHNQSKQQPALSSSRMRK